MAVVAGRSTESLGVMRCVIAVMSVIVSSGSVANPPPIATKIDARSMEQSRLQPVPGPRHRFVGSGRDTPFLGYVSAFSRKVERTANSNYPPAIRGMRGKVQLTTAVRADGTLYTIEIHKSSGARALDEAAMGFVKAAAPFDALSMHSINDVDILHITRTFVFTAEGVRDES